MKRFKHLSGLIILLSVLPFVQPVFAQSEPFIGQMAWVPYNFAPRGWAFCDGQVLPISENTALFSLLGTTFGGDGRTTFALPDVRGRVMLHAGNGPGLSPYTLGQRGGAQSVTLDASQMPVHIHALNATEATADSTTPGGNRIAAKQRTQLYSADTTNSVMDPGSIGASGLGQGHENRPPYLTLNCIIALQGIFPSRN